MHVCKMHTWGSDNALDYPDTQLPDMCPGCPGVNCLRCPCVQINVLGTQIDVISLKYPDTCPLHPGHKPWVPRYMSLHVPCTQIDVIIRVRVRELVSLNGYTPLKVSWLLGWPTEVPASTPHIINTSNWVGF